jgi:predicted ATPase
VTRPYVDQLRLQGFGCFTDTTLALTPLHAVIGPADTGKTTLLRALRALSKYAQVRNVQATMAEFGLYAHETSKLEARIAGAGSAIVSRGRGGWGEHHIDDEARSALGGQHTLRFQPDALREASALIPEGEPLRFLDERGLGLPGVYDAILSRDVAMYVSLSNRLAKLFPFVKNVSLVNASPQTKALGVSLDDGVFVPASAVSDGLLRWLAFAAVPYLAPAALVLVEEPENGLHPAASRDVMALLREVSLKCQVVVVTHSPAVVQALLPSEVTVLRRDDQGAIRAVLLSDAAALDSSAKAPALDE